MRRGMGTSGSAPLPYDAEIEYLKATGGAYINTGYTPNYNTSCIADFMLIQRSSIASSANPIFAGGIQFSNNFFGIYLATNSNNENYIMYNSTYIYQRDNVIGLRLTYYIDLYNHKALFKGVEYELNANDAKYLYPLFLFNANIVGSPYTNINGIYNLYNFVIKESDIIIHDFIPVRIGNVGYLYDRVSGQLFGNANSTGAFVLGPDVQ